MVDYTNPVQTTFELQRQTIEQGHRAIEQTFDIQNRVTGAAVDSLDTQKSAQRSAVELHQSAVHALLDAIDGTIPGADTATEDIRSTVDNQYDALLENHADFFEDYAQELEDGIEAFDEFGDEYLDAVDELLATVIEAHEELEDQSLDALEDFEAQFEDLQEQVEDVQQQVQDVSEQAADVVEA